MTAHDDIDFGRRSDDYAHYRPGFPPSFYRRLGPLEGCRALDLGTGPGTVALELAARGAVVTGIDVSASQVAAAQRLAEQRGLAGRAQFRVASAEQTGAADASVALVTAGQCWHWFDHAAALAEATRVLCAGGRLVVAHYSYLARRSDVARETERLVLDLNPGWRMADSDGIAAGQIDGLQQGALRLLEQFCYDEDREFTHEAWRGRMRTCNGVGSGPMSEAQVAEFDARLAELLRRRFPQEPLRIPHRIWAVVVRKP